MKRINWPLLTAEDIEVRIATCKEGKTTLLLFQNSRTAMNAFDSMFGEFGWQVEYYDAGGQMYCRIGVYDDERGEWIWKSDTGSESNIEAEKGFSSDCLKRTAVRWGYARELYSAPRIVINNDNKFNTYYCRSIGYDNNRKINQLTIVDRTGNIVFNWAAGQTLQMQQQEHKPVERKTNNSVFVIAEKPENNNAMLPKYAFAKICNTQNVNDLKGIWDANPNWHGNNNFKSVVTKRKTALGAAS